MNVSLYEAQDCANQIVEAAGGNLDIKFGVSINPELADQILVSVIATDFSEEYDFTAVPTFRPVQPRVYEGVKVEEVSDTGEEDDSILPNFLKGNDF